MAYLRPDQALNRQGRSIAGAPVAGTDAVQTLNRTGSPTGGTIRFQFKGQKTTPLAHNYTAAQLQTALRALSTIGGANVTVADAGAGAQPFTVTFTGALAKKAVPLIQVKDNQLTGGTAPTVAVTNTTPGVSASFRGAPKGAKLTDTTNGKEYTNTGTDTVPVWTVTGTQS